MLKDLYDDSSIYQDKGFNASFKVAAVSVPPECVEREPLEEAQEELLRDLLEYCQGIEPEVVFVSAPFSPLIGNEAKIRTALDICEEEGFDTLDFNCEPLQSELGVDWSHDLYKKNT